MKIGILGKTIGSIYGVNKTYIEFLEHVKSNEFNTIMVIDPRSDVVSDLDLLILPGGLDIVDENNTPSVFNTSADAMFEYFDKNILPSYILAGIPIFGICRGFQALNKFFNGTLYNELFSHVKSPKDERSKRVHDVKIIKNQRFNYSKEKHINKFEVNSLHHQGIKELGDGLIPLVASSDTKNDYYSDTIEAFIHSKLPIAGVQWHPEEWADRYAYNLINHIVNSVKLNEDEILKILNIK